MWPLTLHCALILIALINKLSLARPVFDQETQFRNILIPADVATGTVIYRLRASDPTFDYPLTFQVRGGATIVSVDSLNCTQLNSLCQANVVLRRRLEPGRFYDFTIEARNWRRAETVLLNCSMRATNASTQTAKVFPGAPALLLVSEGARRNTELGTVVARGSSAAPRGVLLELWGSPLFGLHQRLVNERDARGTILLLGQLDYEVRTVHHLTVLANNPFMDPQTDTRNIASWPLLIAVLDEQDTPPVFTLAPPTTQLSPTLQVGDPILKVHAEDGDRGKPREIRYSLQAENNPVAANFEISDETGELRLKRPLTDLLALAHTSQPILLTVMAEEVRANPQEAPAQSSTVQLALIPPGLTPGSPIFGANEYSTLLDENSPTGTILDLAQAEIITQPGDVVTLELENHNGTFDISPGVVEGQSQFQIKVHDPKLLDYELWHSVECYILAKELNTGNYTARVKLKVLLNDINDNAPEFSQDLYQASVQENAKISTTVLRVEASDIDRAPGNKIRYLKLTGEGSSYFDLDPVTGLITVANSEGLDAELMPVIRLTVECADEDGKGLKATSTVQITLVDINDEAPEFERNVYEFILNPKRNSFTTRALIKALDRDISAPNNEIHYELMTPRENLTLDELSGEFRIRGTLEIGEVIVVKARAWDGGVPRLSDECEVRVYPPEGQSRKMIFIVPGKDPDWEDVKATLRALTGARVSVDDIKPYTGHIPDATDVSGDRNAERSVVYATVSYSKGAVVDVDHIQKILEDRTSSSTTIKRAESQKGPNFWWLLWALIILLLIGALILILCCICQGCPLYIPPKRRKVVSAEITKLVRGSGHGKESKSVQVAEWFGRREAWTPEHVTVDNEVDSLRRHEVDRGSDRTEHRRTLHRQPQIQREPSRDQLYIREGNADILRLITRGNETQRPVTLVNGEVMDSGKDILLRRFIDQQQSEAVRSQQILLPNAVNKLQQEHELLEASLRQQNALLRQILMERERDLRLETQSLPAGTQTDQDQGTQTEPEFLRRTRSDNDASDNSDDELAIIRARIRRRKGTNSQGLRRKIRTPIQEESEIEVEKPQRSKSRKSSRLREIKQTRTSELRQKKASSDARSRSSRSGIRKEVLREISASLERNSEDSFSDQDHEHGATEKRRPRRRRSEEYFSEDSLEEVSPRSDKTIDSGRQRYHSESDLRLISSQSQSQSQSQAKDSARSKSTIDLTKFREPEEIQKTTTGTTSAEVVRAAAASATSKKSSLGRSKRSSRYMEWYNKKPSAIREKSDDSSGKTSVKTKESQQQQDEKVVKEVAKKVSSRLTQDTQSSSRKKVDKKKQNAGPEHPLLQHSEHRFEAQYPLVRRAEEDTDSGIVLARPPMAQKKSVFTIAYDDMHTSQLRPDSNSPRL